MGWQRGNNNQSICGILNIRQDIIAIRWWLPSALEIDDPIIKGGQCFNRGYIIFVDMITQRWNSDRNNNRSSINGNAQTFLNRRVDFAGFPFIGRINSIIHVPWDGGNQYQNYGIRVNFSQNPNQSSQNVMALTEDSTTQIVSVSNIRITRADGTSLQQDIVQCGQKKIQNCSDPKTPDLPNGQINILRNWIGSRIAITEENINNNYIVRIQEYLPFGIPSAPPPLGSGLRIRDILVLQSPPNCNKFAIVEFLCNPRQEEKCPPNTCFKCLNKGTGKVCCFGSDGKLLRIVEKDAEMDYCE